MHSRALFVFIALFLTGAPTVFAMSESEITDRFNQYESKIKALEEKLEAYTPNTNKKLVKGVKKNKKRLAKLKKLLDAKDERFQMNGFMTAAVSKADAPIGSDYHFNDRVNFKGDSKIGIQFDYKLSEDMDATIQLVARSRDEDSWTVDAEWAYVGKDFTDWMKVRAGRLRIPFYLYSESLDVGFSYPWVRPPMDMYTTIITSFDGMDTVFKFNTGPVNHRAQIWVAGWTNTNADALRRLDVYDTWGLNVTSSWNAFTFRLATTSISVEGTQTVERFDEVPSAFLGTIAGAAGGSAECLSTNALVAENCSRWDLVIDIEDTINYDSAALQFDNGSLFAVYEVAVLRLKDETIFGNSRSDVITMGYRFGSFSPYIGAGRSDSDPAGLDPDATGKTSRDSWTLGLQHTLNDSTSVKIEWNRFFDFEGTEGFSSDALEPGETNLDDVNIYTIAVDAVF